MASEMTELRAELAALREMLKLIAPMVFEQAGVSAENVEAYGADLTKEIQAIDLPGANPETLQRVRDSRATAVADLFSRVADSIRAGGGGEPDFGG